MNRVLQSELAACKHEQQEERVKQVNQLKERAKLRANEERRLDHAYKTFVELMIAHKQNERDIADLYSMHARLVTAIKNQHIKDTSYAAYKSAQIDTETIQGY